MREYKRFFLFDLKTTKNNKEKRAVVELRNFYFYFVIWRLLWLGNHLILKFLEGSTPGAIRNENLKKEDYDKATLRQIHLSPIIFQMTILKAVPWRASDVLDS